MVDLHGYDYVYECLPAIPQQDGSLKVKMKVMPFFDAEKLVVELSALNIEARTKKERDHIGKKVVAIEGLRVDGKEVTSYEQLMETGPNELVAWIGKAVYNTQLLSEAEVKNS